MGAVLAERKKVDFDEQNHVFLRIGAYGIDILLVFFFMELLGMLLGVNRAEQSTVDQLKFDITVNIVFSLYTFVFARFIMKGQTLGKRAVGLRVVSTNSGDNSLDVSKLLFREMIGKLFVEKINIWLVFLLVFSGVQDWLFVQIGNQTVNTTIYYMIMLPWPLFISFAMLVNSPDHRCLHDILSDTKVVYMPKKFKFD